MCRRACESPIKGVMPLACKRSATPGSSTTFDPDTNTDVDKDPEDMVKMLDARGK